jgi:hypothetical protein
MFVELYKYKRHGQLWKIKSPVKLMLIFVAIGYIIQFLMITIFNIMLRHNVPIPG